MTGKEAMAVVDRMTFVVQRMRSITMEELGSDEITRKVLADLQPWVHGPKSVLPALTKIQDRGSVTPGELYNFCIIARELEPTIGITSDIMEASGWAPSGITIPEPTTRWLADQWS